KPELAADLEAQINISRPGRKFALGKNKAQLHSAPFADVSGNAQLKGPPLIFVVSIAIAVAERESHLTIGQAYLIPNDFVSDLKRLNGLGDCALENEREVIADRLVCLKAHLRAVKTQLAGHIRERICVERVRD